MGIRATSTPSRFPCPYRDRVFNPAITIWGFLSQVLSEDHSCGDAVSRMIARRADNGDFSQMFYPLWQPELPRVTSEQPRTMEVEWSLRVYLRWLHCFNAGHAAESSDLPRSRPSKSQGWAFHWPGSVCCYRSLLALVTIWASLPIAAKAPAK